MKEGISSLNIKNLKKLIFFFLIMMAIGIPSSGRSENLSMCLARPFSLENKYLSCLKSSAVATGTRAAFNTILTQRKKCKNCAESFPGEINFSPLYALDFLLMTINPNGFGGYWVFIIFKESPTRIYRLWLYPIDKNVFQIRDIEALVPTAKTKKTMAKLSDTKYSKYWIRSSERP